MKTRKTRRLAIQSVLTAAVFLFSLIAIIGTGVGRTYAAAKYPSKAFKLVVPWKPGGGTDRSARVFAPYLAKALGVPVNVVNISGGGGWVAWSQMARWKAPQDEYMLGYANMPNIFAYLNPQLKITARASDFGWLALHTMDPNLWVVRGNETRFRTLRQLLAYMRKHPNNPLTFQASGVGGDNYLSGMAALKALGDDYKFNFIEANGDGEKIANLLGGTSDVCGSNTAYYIPYIMEGKILPLCVLNDKRLKQLPSVPTFEEITGKEVLGFAARCLVGPSNLSASKKAILIKAIEKAASDPAYVVSCMKSGTILDIKTGDALMKMIHSTEEMAKSIAYWKK